MELTQLNTKKCILKWQKCINPPRPVTARVKISPNVDKLAKVYPMHLKVKHYPTLRAVSTFTVKNESTVFDW